MTVEPRWLTDPEIFELHSYVLARTGGSPGLRDAGLLSSALTRPVNRWCYEGVEDVRALAATYAVGLARNHPFVDGNKRAAFLGLGLFLELNGWMLLAADEDATRAMFAVASGEMDEGQLAAWIRANSVAT